MGAPLAAPFSVDEDPVRWPVPAIVVSDFEGRVAFLVSYADDYPEADARAFAGQVVACVNEALPLLKEVTDRSPAHSFNERARAAIGRAEGRQ